MKSDQATLLLRIPSSLHQRLKQEARALDLSLNKHCSNLLRKEDGSVPGEKTVSLSLAGGRAEESLNLQVLSVPVVEVFGDKIEAIALYGSFARGRAAVNSDIDLLIVMNEGIAFDRDIYSHWNPRKFNGREVAPLFVHLPGMEERTSGLWFEVALDGILLYDKNLRLSGYLSYVRGQIVQGNVERRVTHGHPYWVYLEKPGRTPSFGGDP